MQGLSSLQLSAGKAQPPAAVQVFWVQALPSLQTVVLLTHQPPVHV
ncbi:MAG: hypothetical protein AB7G88_07555 [Thermomicrobiales bacterium]